MDTFSTAMDFADDKRKSLNWGSDVSMPMAALAGAGLLTLGLAGRRLFRKPPPPPPIMAQPASLVKQYALPAVGIGLMAYGLKDMFR